MMNVMGRDMTSVPGREAGHPAAGTHYLVWDRAEDTTYSAFNGRTTDPWLTVSAWLWLAYFGALGALLGWLVQ